MEEEKCILAKIGHCFSEVAFLQVRKKGFPI